MNVRRSPAPAAFVERGFREREVFDHRVVTIAKQYPDLLADLQARGFSYNHRIMDLSQLRRVREVNLKARGYRPPRSVLTAELTDYRLSLARGERPVAQTPGHMA